MTIKHSFFHLKKALVLVLICTNLSWSQDQFPQFKSKLDQTLSEDELYLSQKNNSLEQLKEKLRHTKVLHEALLYDAIFLLIAPENYFFGLNTIHLQKVFDLICF
jgi:hypothetical protein